MKFGQNLWKRTVSFSEHLKTLHTVIGTIGAIFHGAAFPVMIVFYGQMTESFVQWSICDEMVGQVSCRTHFGDNLVGADTKRAFSTTFLLDIFGQIF